MSGQISVATPAQVAILAALAHQKKSGILLIGTPTITSAEELTKELGAWLENKRVAMLPAWETLPFERISPSIEVMGKRLFILHELVNSHENSASNIDIVVAPTRALLQKSPTLNIKTQLLKVGAEHNREELLDWFSAQGYRREIQVSARGEIAVRGGIVDVFASAPIGVGCDKPLRIEFFGDHIESMRTFSLTNQLAIKEINQARLLPAREFIPQDAEKARAKKLATTFSWGQKHWEDLAEGVFFEGMESWMCWLAEDVRPITKQVSKDVQIIWLQQNEIQHTATLLKDQEQELAGALMETWGAKEIEDYPRLTALFEDVKDSAHFVIDDLPFDKSSVSTNQLVAESWGISGPEVIPRLKELLSAGFQVDIPCWSQESAKKMKDALYDEGVEAASVSVAQISSGCIFSNLKLAILPEPQILKKQYVLSPESTHEKNENEKSSAKNSQALENAWMGQLVAGTFVVHKKHGIGKYMGTETKVMDGTEREYLFIQYKGNDRLYVPVEQIGSLSLYSVGETPRLNSLSGSSWRKTQSRVKAEAREIAEELVELYGERSTIKGYSFSKDGAPHQDLAAKFFYLETPDQLEAIKSTTADMEKSTPMDRLIYGDVGFGKTEIAIRAAFKAITENKQVAILVPTTLLARQHYYTFSERYSDFPIRVEMLSRLVSSAKAKETIKSLATGGVDLVIGTHRLLSNDIRFKDLGLLVVDEEQRFGVKQKEKIKSFHKQVDILTLTATPIPRTLEMSLVGIKDYSIIKTSPLERHPILTYVGIYDRLAVKEAIRRELLREGQVFFVHNRIGSISKIKKELNELVPEARVAIAHGRMNEHQLEQVVLDFTDKKYDVLLCTTIIEAGIDMPRVNTLVVDRAERLGLGQLHQLRGRVGRAGIQAYTYLFTTPEAEISPEAAERLRTIGEVTALGSGFHLAMRDLEIRGAGNLLGFGQSGHIASIGYDMYCDLVNDAVLELKGQAPPPRTEVVMDLPVEAHLPNDYVEDETLRLDAYRNLFKADGFTGIEDIGEQWRDRFGPLPEPAVQLLSIARLRLLCQELGIESLSLIKNSEGKRFVRYHTAMLEKDRTAKNQAVLELNTTGANISEEIFSQLIKIKEALGISFS